MKKFSDNLIIVSMAEAKQPLFREVKSKAWITYGDDDQYPSYLLNLYNKSAKHNAIISNKVKYVMGKGFGVSDKAYADIHKNSSAYKFINSINSNGEDIDEVGIKCAIDLELYGGFYLEIIWNKARQIGNISHCDYLKLRSNYDNSKFYYRKDANFYTKNQADLIINAFDPENPVGKQILYYKDYRPGMNTYTLPSYIGALNYIEADILVGAHTFTNAAAGFMPSKLINFNNGEPDEDQKRKIEKRIDDKFLGVGGKKTILSFNANPATAPTVIDLGQSDLSKEDFSVVDNLISQNIYAGHQITSPILFGIKEAGQLGGRNEMREAYEIFHNIYANSQQQKLENTFNWIASFNDIKEKLEILRSEPIGFEFSESIIAQNLTQSEIREKIGATSSDTENEELLQAIDRIRILPSKIGDKIIETLDANELRVMIGLQPVKLDPVVEEQKMSAALESINDLGLSKQDFVIVKSKPVKFSSDKEMVESELSIYQNFADVEIDISTKEAQILDLIKKDKRIEVEGIAEALKLKVKDVQKILNLLTNLDYIKTKTVTKNGVETIERTVNPNVSREVKKETIKEISVKYSYEEKPNIPEAIVSRPFCAKLMDLDRLYDRKDIETMSARLGYSVWDRKGGWYNNPKTGKTSPECRHEWRQNLVVKKIQ